jgi:hypothetical protein
MAAGGGEHWRLHMRVAVVVIETGTWFTYTRVKWFPAQALLNDNNDTL